MFFVHERSLCVCVQMIGWKPDVYTSVDELPEEMPQDLKDHIAESTAAKGGNMPKVIALKYTWHMRMICPR